MINVSSEFRRKMNSGHNFIYEFDITLADGTVLFVDNSKIWDGGVSFSEATSSANSFDVGCAVTTKLRLVLNNIYGEYSPYDFTDAQVNFKKIGLELDDGTVESFRKGFFIVEDASYDGAVITLNCLDHMSKFDVLYSSSTLVYPATLQQIVTDACLCCGVAYNLSSFSNSAYQVEKRPDSKSLTFGDVLAMVCQIACVYGKIDAYGRLQFDWYKEVEMEIYDGGSFAYNDGDTLDGGSFRYNDGDTADGNVLFIGSSERDSLLFDKTNLTKATVGTDDVVITGVRVSTRTDEREDEVSTFGAEGYIISISNNDLIQQGRTNEVATFIGNKIVGMRFRPVDISVFSDPTVESGDSAVVSIKDGERYNTYLTNVSFASGQNSRLSCGAESVRRNSANNFSLLAKAIQKAKEEIHYEKTQRELAIESLESQLTNSGGFFLTEVPQEDGSTISYMHDKRTLADSRNVIKITADAIGISNDGGKTYPYGLQMDDATAILNKIYAQGIDANYITVNNELLPQRLAEISKQAEDIEASVDETKSYIDDELGKLNKEISDSNEDVVKTTQGLIQELQNKILSESNGIFSQFSVDTNGVHITYIDPVSKDQGEINMNGSDILFKINGVEKSKITSSGFHFDFGILTTALQIGNVADEGGEWIWTKSQTGHFRLVHRG